MKDHCGTEEDVKVSGRDFNPVHDEAFIYATWRNGAYYGGNKHRQPSEFFSEQTMIIKEILSRPDCKVRIACINDAPDVILGYAVFTGDAHLEWIFVKQQFRGKSIGSFITLGLKTVAQPMTRIGNSIMKKKNLKIKGDSNDETTKTQS